MNNSSWSLFQHYIIAIYILPLLRRDIFNIRFILSITYYYEPMEIEMVYSFNNLLIDYLLSVNWIHFIFVLQNIDVDISISE